jgi:tetratricopeptide (TPR) repeat protein
MKSKTPLILFSILLLTVGYMTSVTAVTDAELEALEKQIEQQEEEEKQKVETEKKRVETEAKYIDEQKRKAKAEAKRKTELEEKRKAEVEAKKKSEEARFAETEQQRKEAEEKKREKEESYNEHIKLAEAYMTGDKFDMAIKEYQVILESFPDDDKALEGLNKAMKYLNACDDIVGKWFVEPAGITWIVYDDNTIFGTWLIFSSSGLWECVNGRDREFFISWPDCGVCEADYFFLSEDNNTLKTSRNNNAHGTRITDFKKGKTTKSSPKIGL